MKRGRMAEAYELGYREGARDVYADWLHAWDIRHPDQPCPTFEEAAKMTRLTRREKQTLVGTLAYRITARDPHLDGPWLAEVRALWSRLVREI